MAKKLTVHHEKVTDPAALAALCPFNALEVVGGRLDITAACKLCNLCVKHSDGAITLDEDTPAPAVDKSCWTGITVYADHVDGVLHPVTFELLGKARALAAPIGHPVHALVMGSGMEQACQTLLRYGADKVFCYDHPALRHFNIETYTNVFEQYIGDIKPSVLLTGATNAGRQLAPRVAARLKTGLTADCTVLEMEPSTDLIQIRPAFGGNIMAEIHTPNHRPQMATVRYKVMTAPTPDVPTGEVVRRPVPPDLLNTGIRILSVAPKPPETSIEHADVLVVAGRGVRRREDLERLEDLSARLGGMLACTRPLVEQGWMDARRQIGLSGRTVRPKLLLAFGVSGAVQFSAGMKNAEVIIAVNLDENAPIFEIAHYCLVGDLYEVLPRLLEEVTPHDD